MNNDFTIMLMKQQDQTTVGGFAQALLLAMRANKDENRKLYPLYLCDDPEKEIIYAKQIAQLMIAARGEK
jgi:hypothetical protein